MTGKSAVGAGINQHDTVARERLPQCVGWIGAVAQLQFSTS
jgi:hypothetical protein